MYKTISMIFLAVLLTGCDCEDMEPLVPVGELPNTFRVVNLEFLPEVTGPTLLLPDRIRVTFNRSLDGKTIEPGTNLFLEGDRVLYDSTYFLSGNVLEIRCGSYICREETCTVTLRLIGDDIFSTQQEVLDGDRDGTPGGTFAENLIVEQCQPPVFVLRPPANQSLFTGFTLSSQSISFSVLFSGPVDRANVTVGENFVLRGENGQVLPGTLTWQSDTQVTFQSTVSPFQFCTGSDCCWRLQLFGTLPAGQPILDIFGLPLDGDRNGTAGGNFATSFCVIG